MPRIAATTEPLDANGEWNSGTLQPEWADRIVGMVYASHTGDIYIEQSADGTNWDIQTTYAIAADDGKGFSEEIIGPYVRIRYVNDAVAQTEFRLSARMTSAGPR
jgi:hypothetical protein